MMPAISAETDDDPETGDEHSKPAASSSTGSSSLRMMNGRLGRVRKKKRKKGSSLSSKKKTPASATSSQIRALLALLLVLVVCIVLEMIVVDSLFLGGTDEDEGMNQNGAEAGVDSVVKGSAGVPLFEKKKVNEKVRQRQPQQKNLRGLAQVNNNNNNNNNKLKDAGDARIKSKSNHTTITEHKDNEEEH